MGALASLHPHPSPLQQGLLTQAHGLLMSRGRPVGGEHTCKHFPGFPRRAAGPGLRAPPGGSSGIVMSCSRLWQMLPECPGHPWSQDLRTPDYVITSLLEKGLDHVRISSAPAGRRTVAATSSPRAAAGGGTRGLLAGAQPLGGWPFLFSGISSTLQREMMHTRGYSFRHGDSVFVIAKDGDRGRSHPPAWGSRCILARGRGIPHRRQLASGTAGTDSRRY